LPTAERVKRVKVNGLNLVHIIRSTLLSKASMEIIQFRFKGHTTMSANLNSTMDETQPSDCYSAGNLTAAKIGKPFAYCLIIVVSLTGNSLIGIIIYKKKPMRKKINYFILNMAMSDILISIFIISVHFVELLVKLSRTMCKVAPIVKYLSCVVSVESLVLNAVDRFGALPYSRFVVRSSVLTSILF